MAGYVVIGSLDTNGTFTPASMTGGTLDVNAVVSVSASIAPFAPGGVYAAINAGTATAQVALPAGVAVEVFNTGTNTAFVNLGTSSGVTSSTLDIPIAANSWLGFAVGTNTNIAAITSSGTATLTIAGGSGLPTGAGGGSTGGGGVSSTVTLAAGSALVGHVVNDAGTAVIGHVIVDSGTLTANGTITATGTVALAAGSALVGKVGIDQTTPGTTNLVSIGSNGTVTATGTVNATGTLTVAQATGTNLHTVVDAGTLTLVSAVTGITNTVIIAGVAASGVAVSGNPLLDGGRAQNAEATAVTNGQAVATAHDLVGRTIQWPYANKENLLSGAISSTGTAGNTLSASPGASTKIYMTSLQLGNTGTGNVIATLNDTATTILVLPGGGGSNLLFPSPLVWAANTAATVTFGTATTTGYASFQGFKGS